MSLQPVYLDSHSVANLIGDLYDIANQLTETGQNSECPDTAFVAIEAARNAARHLARTLACLNEFNYTIATRANNTLTNE